MRNRIILSLLAAFFLPCWAIGQDAPRGERSIGTLSNGNVYQNADLGLTFTLPGSWQLRANPDRGERVAGCSGPLCRDADINVSLSPVGDHAGRYHVFLAAWKLSPEYQNRNRYPLKWFAEIMTTGSLGQSNWVPIGSLTAAPLGGLPAYRLLVGNPGAKEPGGFGYVAESNHYIFLLVGSGALPVDESALQSAVEKVEFSTTRP
jgi:hypothetical protein